MKNSGLQFLLPYMRPYRRALIIGAVYAFFGAAASAFSPYWLGMAIDSLNEGVDPRQLAIYSAGLIALALVVAVFRYLLRMLTGHVAAGITYRMSQDLFQRLLLFDQKTRQAYGTGDLLSRGTSDFIYIWRFYSAGYQMSIHAFFLLLIGCALMALSSPLLAGIVMLTLIVVIAFQLKLGSVLERSFVRVQEEMANLSAFVQEHLNAAPVLTAYRQEQGASLAFQRANQTYVDHNLKFVLKSAAISPLPALAVRLAAALVILIGGLMIMGDTLTVGEYVQFIVYLGLLTAAAQQIRGAFERLQQGSAAAGRIGEILHRWPLVTSAPDAVDIDIEGAIRFDNVGVWAEDQKRWVLRDINLEIEPGTTVGIVGATGSGKSMLISLLGRIYDPDEGSVQIDGHDLRTIRLRSLRKDVIYVPQETLLFNMPLRNNIALGVPETPDPQLREAIHRARLSNDLPQLPRGLDSMVGERGTTLSGGQRQRTALARALVRNPKVLLLDDALASVDMKTSAEIITELGREHSQRTIIIVSQRLAAVQAADQIVVLDEGRIVEQGDHQTLLAIDGFYAEMVRHETREIGEEVGHVNG